MGKKLMASLCSLSNAQSNVAIDSHNVDVIYRADVREHEGKRALQLVGRALYCQPQQIGGTNSQAHAKAKHC